MARVGRSVTHTHLVDMGETKGSFNPSGDEQKAFDLTTHQWCIQELEATQAVCAVLSEEAEDWVDLSNMCGRYVVAFDPLDGSTNIEVNAPTGTIFSVYERRSPVGSPIQTRDILQPGEHQVASGYLLYSTYTMFFYTTRNGVHGFVYVPSFDDFFLVYPDKQIPYRGKGYAANDGHFDGFPGNVQRYIQRCRKQGCLARYAGAFVTDFHRCLMHGGIFMYPTTARNPKGKLRLMLECNAMALIAEQAGGAASTGQQSILSVQPQSIHQPVPIYIGSRGMVEDLCRDSP